MRLQLQQQVGRQAVSAQASLFLWEKTHGILYCWGVS